jgi:hypothetical protein
LTEPATNDGVKDHPNWTSTVFGLSAEQWAEIRKTMDMEAVIRSIDRVREDAIWFDANLDRLRESYLDKWVAVRSKTVIDSDPDHDRLMDRIEARPDGFVDVQVLHVFPKGTVFV